MKKVLVMAAMVLFMPMMAQAQDEGTESFLANFQNNGMQTYLRGDVDHGFYGGPVVKFSTFEDGLGLYVGGKGAWLIDHKIGVGIAGYGLINNMNYSEYNDNELKLQTGYGGLFLEYVNDSRKLIHFSVGSLIGAGGAAYMERFRYEDRYYDEHQWEYDVVESSAYFVIEPEVSVEFNITEFFMIGVGGSYRMVSNTDLFEHTDSDLSGPSGNITFKFGKF